MAGSYEKEQERLEKLFQEFLSDEEEDPFESQATSDEYEPSDEEHSSESSEEDAPVSQKFKRQKVLRTKKHDIQSISPLPCTSRSLSPDNQNIDSSSYESEEEIPSNLGHVDRVTEDAIANIIADSSSENVDEQTEDNVKWGTVDVDKLKKIQFTVNNSGINMNVINAYNPVTPYDFYKLLVTNEIISNMVEQTNIYAEQCRLSKTHKPFARIHKWKNTTPSEMEKFIGMIFWMGLCRYPQIRDYWTRRPSYKNEISKTISRNRFELLLKMWHLNNNEAPSIGRLHKIDPLINQLKERFQLLVTPGEEVCIDETLVPFRGRLIFRQYIANKRHKFGIKLFKLCLQRGYTYDLKVYCGKEERNKETSVATKVVMELMKNCINAGRTLCTDNYYTSVALARELLENKTNLVCTLRKNRKNNPRDVIDAKLKKGEHITKQSNTGCVVTKWKDKRDVLMLSTKHGSSAVTVRRRGVDIEKPEVVVYYNKLKGFIDLSDQLKAYAPCLRRGVKWYRKLAVELQTGMAVVNAYILFQDITKSKISITRFKEAIAETMLQLNQAPQAVPQNPEQNHLLKMTEKKSRCTTCYAKLKEEKGRVVTQKKNKTNTL